MTNTNDYILFPCTDGRGPSIYVNDKWFQLDDLDKNVVSRLAHLEYTISNLNIEDSYINAIGWDLRMVQHAYYTARSMAIVSHHSMCRSLPGRIQPHIKEVYFPREDPVHSIKINYNLHPALLLAIEGFYHTAFRIVDYTRRNDCTIPRIVPMGVIQVCNRIVKHSKPSSGFKLGGAAFTLQLNGGAPLDDGFRDPGVAENCSEFLVELENSIKSL